MVMELILVTIVCSFLKLSQGIQPSAQSPIPNQEIRDIEWGDLNFLHTTDSHGFLAGHLQEPQYSADLGDYVSFVRHMRKRADERGVDLLVIDTGDRAEGNGLWDASDPKGAYARRITKQMDVDFITTGNHELYNGTTALDEHLEIVPHFGNQYLSSNIDIYIGDEWVPFANRTAKITTKKLGLEISAFGFLFNFTGNDQNTRVKPVADVLKEDWFQASIHDSNVDLFLVVAHIDIHTLELQQIHDAIRRVNPKTPIQFFGGHSHIRDFKVFDAKSSALESGRYCETVGWLSINGLYNNTSTPIDDSPIKFFRRYIDFNRIGFQYHSGTEDSNFDTPKGLSLSSEIANYRRALDLDRLIGCAPRNFTLSKDRYPSPGNWYSFLNEKILPKMVYNKNRHSIPHMIFINGGSQRYDVFEGAFTYDTSFLVSPFTSRFQYAKDIEWSVATKLLSYFLADQSSYVAMSLRKGDLPPVPLDEYTYPTPPCPAVNQLNDGSQIPIAAVQTKSSYSRTEGYTTKDDFGDTGDDTVHVHVPYYPNPKVIQANASFPNDYEVNPPSTLDLVFFDFIAENVAEGLNSITGTSDYQASAFENYMGKEDTMTKLLLDFVSTYWKC